MPHVLWCDIFASEAVHDIALLFGASSLSPAWDHLVWLFLRVLHVPLGKCMPYLQAVSGWLALALHRYQGVTISAPGIAGVTRHLTQSTAFTNLFDLFPSWNSWASPDAQLYLLTWAVFVLKMLLVNADAVTAVWVTALNCISFASCPPSFHIVIRRQLQLINTVLCASLHMPVSSCSICSFWFHTFYFWYNKGEQWWEWCNAWALFAQHVLCWSIAILSVNSWPWLCCSVLPWQDKTTIWVRFGRWQLAGAHTKSLGSTVTARDVPILGWVDHC